MSIPLRSLFLHHLAQTSPAPMGIEVESSEGVYIHGKGGDRWIDLISGISVCNVGHRHPRVVEAIKAQVDRYMHVMVYGEYIQSPQIHLAERLASLVPGLDSVYLVNSGAEAIEGAIKLARRATGRKKLFSFRDAYHGSTTGALSLMSSDYFTEPFKPLLPEVFHFESYSESVLEKIDTDTAAVFIEIIRAEVGAIPVEHTILHAIQKRCRETGALLVVDEIQTGFGRTGPFLASSAAGIEPDILVLAKGMGGGLPIGAFISSGKLMQTLSNEPVLGHITTFGGNPVCCAAALAVFDVVKELDTDKMVPEKEAFIRKKLNHPALRSIDGKGLLLALDFGEEALAQRIIKTCIRNGVLTDWFLFAPHKLRMAPPLTITLEELDSACTIILKSIDEALEKEPD